MTEIGRTATLTIVGLKPAGAVLDGGSLGDILVPHRELPAGAKVGDALTIFIYRDSEGRLTGSLSRPLAELGQCAFMKIVTATKAGVFADWGLPKDLFIPASEQYKALEVGRSYVVLVFLDERSGRLAGTTRLHSHLSEDGSGFKPGQEVDLLICGFSDMGYRAVVDNTHLGLVFRDDAPGELRYGQRVKGHAKAIRPDRKLDLSLLPPGLSGLDLLAARILDHLRDNGGSSPLTDSSPPERIAAVFGASKSAYKKALGRLYKARRIGIEPDRIVLTQPDSPPSA